MLVIRFNRTGKKNLAYFRVVLQERTQAPGKRHVEILGSYDPHKKTSVLKKERILYWIGQGAQTSPVVTNLFIREGVITGKKIAKKMPRPAIKEEVKVEETPVVKSEEVKEEIKEELKTESVPIEEKEEKREEVKEETKIEETPVAAETKTEETPKA
jgi:small subunit ribosomal protein S16